MLSGRKEGNGVVRNEMAQRRRRGSVVRTSVFGWRTFPVLRL